MQSVSCALCVLLLAGCGQSSTPAPGAGTTVNSDTVTAAAAPPGAGDRPAALGTTGAPKDANGLPVLAPRGVNASQLFAQKLSDPDDRMARLENAVQEMRNDFDAMAPSIVRLVAVEKDIQELVGQLETLVATAPPAPVESQGLMPDDTEFPVSAPAGGETGADGAPLPLSSELPATAEETAASQSPASPAPSQTAPAPAQAPAAVAAPQTPPPAVSASPPAPATTAAAGITVSAIRVGEHPGKTRIVLDVTGKADFSADLDNGEKILVVELPGAGWNAVKKDSFATSPLLASYEVNPGNGGKGSLLVIKLKADAALLYKGTMPADSGKGVKIVIDLGKAAGSAVPTQ